MSARAELPPVVAQPRLTSVRRWLSVGRAYLALTKPRIIELLLITTVPSMVLAAKGWPGWWLVGATVLGGYLSAGGAGAVNCYLDRDVDQLMQRTRHRPIVTGEVGPRRALLFGIVLGLLAIVELALLVNLLSALLALAAYAFYVFVYTMWLKRTTPQNIVIGGAAGAMPPLVGWAAVTNHLAWPPLVMFAVIFIWTPPHFWALALRFRDDYERAHIPMLPVARGERETLRQILLYSAALVAVSATLLLTGAVGIVYGVAVALLGGWFLLLAQRLLRSPGPRSAMSLFNFSIYYLAVLFVAMTVDQFAQHLFGHLW